jgi:hypothetical protein
MTQKAAQETSPCGFVPGPPGRGRLPTCASTQTGAVTHNRARYVTQSPLDSALSSCVGRHARPLDPVAPATSIAACPKQSLRLRRRSRSVEGTSFSFCGPYQRLLGLPAVHMTALKHALKGSGTLRFAAATLDDARALASVQYCGSGALTRPLLDRIAKLQAGPRLSRALRRGTSASL